MQIEQVQVEKLAKDVRILLTDEEKTAYMDRLNQTMQLIDLIKEVNTEGVQATITPATVTNRVRTDEIEEAIDREVLQGVAQITEYGYFKVPAILD